NATLTSWPSTRLLTVTVLKAVTVPSPVRYTGISPCRAVAATTGTAGAGAFVIEAGPACVPGSWKTRYALAPITPSNTNSQSHQRCRGGAAAGSESAACGSGLEGFTSVSSPRGASAGAARAGLTLFTDPAVSKCAADRLESSGGGLRGWAPGGAL